MSSSSSSSEGDHDNIAPDSSEPPAGAIHSTLEDADDDTLRILVSTDNHVGYNESDPVRGNDSFAALEEVLYLAKHYGVDMVLLAGDLFHHNKPSRRTLHKTMELFRNYCLGPDPIRIQIVSDSKKTFPKGIVNYEHPCYSVELPVFSIHGNHDDPTREGAELYCALDLLDCANLVNYVGRQDEVKDVEISPILFRKGSTKVALFGLGNLRDERLNRMWRNQKVRFLRPASSDGGDDNNNDDDDDKTPWFNLFALHQNRDTGRGRKNCVQESFIPEWMDLVVWGHEHECCIEPQESVVGTFRITQPGSSVATSLTVGESARKKVGILDIRGTQFRLKPMPLTQVRSFVLGDVSLQEQRRLDPDDAKVEQKVHQILHDQVQVLIHNAREQQEEFWEDAKNLGNPIAKLGRENLPLLNSMNKPDEVLVRLKVEHSGFSTLSNHKFGAQFIGDVANPTDVLLFHRRKVATGHGESSASAKSRKNKRGDPVPPDDLEEMNMEELIEGEIELGDNKLELLEKKSIAGALDEYVQKQQAQAINDMVNEVLGKQQKRLIRRGGGAPNDVADDQDNTDVGRKKRSHKQTMDENDHHHAQSDDEVVGSPSPVRKPARSRSTKSNDSDMETSPPKKATTSLSKRNQSRKVPDSYPDSSEDQIEVVSPPARRQPQPARRSAKVGKPRYEESESDVEIEDDEEPPPKKSRGAKGSRAGGNRSSRNAAGQHARKGSSRGRTPSSSQQESSFTQSQLSFAPAGRPSRSAKSRTKYTVDDEDDVSDESIKGTRSKSFDLEEDWGSANTNTYKSK